MSSREGSQTSPQRTPHLRTGSGERSFRGDSYNDDGGGGGLAPIPPTSRRNSGTRGGTRRNRAGQNGLQRKAVLRNKDEELRDPDFRRAHNMCVSTTIWSCPLRINV